MRAATLLALAVLCGTGQNQPMGPVFSAGVDAVRVDVLVTRNGKPVGGLTASDFALRDNGVPQAVRSVLVEQLPLDLVLVLDQSGSVTGEPLAQLRAAVTEAMVGLAPADRAGLVTFSEHVVLAVPPTSDRGQIERALEQATMASGATALRDAVYAALLLQPEADRRMVVLAFSDGADTASWLTTRDVVQVAGRTDAVVYGVVTIAPSAPAVPSSQTDVMIRGQDGGWLPRVTASGVSVARHSDVAAHRFLSRVAGATGGRTFPVDKPKELKAGFAKALSEMRSRYVLSYVPEGVSREGWHTLDVAVARPGATVVARPGYNVPHAAEPH